MKFILASASERRKELLARIINDLEVKISDFDEESIKNDSNIEDNAMIFLINKYGLSNT